MYGLVCFFVCQLANMHNLIKYLPLMCVRNLKICFKIFVFLYQIYSIFESWFYCVFFLGGGGAGGRIHARCVHVHFSFCSYCSVKIITNNVGVT